MTSATIKPDQLDDFFGAGWPETLGVAVSGGSDSLALLHLLAERGKSQLFAVTVDHRLRPGSAGEALHVSRLCSVLGVSHDTLVWEGWDGRGNLQAEARRTRHALIADWAHARGIRSVALGHTMDDQAETFLMRLARESGVDGLSGMPPVLECEGIRLIRPLLLHRRSDLKSYLKERGIRWVDDPSNEDAGFERVRAREVLAALRPLGIGAETLARSASYLREAREALSEASVAFARDHAKVVAGDVLLDRARLNRQPGEVRRRLLAGAFRWVSSSEYPPRRRPLAEAEAACHDPKNLTLHGCRLLVSEMAVRVAREHAAVDGLETPTDQPWDTRWRLRGPHEPALSVRALGDTLNVCPDWRETGLPRASLLASPAIWRGPELVAAPLAGMPQHWSAETGGLDDFLSSLAPH